MTRNRISLIMVGIICVSLLSCSDKKPEGKTQEKTDKWIYVGETENGILYYDKMSVTKVNPKIIKVWTREKLSKVNKDKIIQDRKYTKQPIEGWDRLDITMFLEEEDCMNYTTKTIKRVDYDDEGKVLYEYKNPNPMINEIIPHTIGETLHRKVCQE
jgi:hypothetical protein